MRVHIIHFDDVADYETMSHELEVYADWQKAKERFDDIVDDFKRSRIEWEIDDWEESDGVTAYESWPDGEWGTNHYAVYLETVEVQ